ncbi:chemotaxis regulator CheZ [compost metagenome]
MIARVVNLAANLEEQLVQMLIQTAPPGGAVPAVTIAPKQAEVLAGPVVDASRTPDVVTSQSQVDDLLASLGF